MQANMKELSTNMKQLDEESAQLFEKLGNLRAELEVESAQFEERKQARKHTALNVNMSPFHDFPLFLFLLFRTNSTNC